MIKTCNKHGETEFSGNTRLRCKKCNVEAVTRRRILMKEKAVAYKGGACSVCGYNRYIGALEFHHRNPVEKDFSIGGNHQTAAWDTIQKELDKCDILCSNCHKEIHETMRR